MNKNSIRKTVVVAIVAIFMSGSFIPVVGSENRNISTSQPFEESEKIETNNADLNHNLNQPTNKTTQFINDDFHGEENINQREIEPAPRDDPEPMPLDVNSPWWNQNWTCRKEITIDHTKIDADLTNFPVLISTTDNDLKDNALDDGDDIAFTDASGTQLNHEIEYFDGSTGELIAWVNVTSLSSTTNTTLYMYYGNLSASSQQNPEDVWDSNYVMVQHLNEMSDPHEDSTSYNNDGNESGGVDQSVTGRIDGADDFERESSNYVEISYDASLELSTYTIEAWTKLESVGSPRGILGTRFGGDTTFDVKWESNVLHGDIGDGTGWLTTADYAFTPSAGTWYYVVYAVTSGGDYKIYLDGIYKTGNTFSGTPKLMKSGQTMRVGDSFSAEYFDGILDEVRISNTARNSSWISTSYNNVNDASDFVNFGSQQKQNVAPTISNPIPHDGATGQELNPILSITINDANNDSMNVTFRTNASDDTWTEIGSNNSVYNGTYSQTPANMDSYDTKYWWSVNCTDGTVWTNKTYNFTTRLHWWNASWFFRKEITIDHNMVEENLTNFPVLISLDSDSNLSSHARLNGNDIVFTDANGLKLNHEIELFNHTAGKLIAWVNVTNLSSTTNTTLYIYYGNPSCENQENVSGVWDSGFVMVQHLNETGDMLLDSTTYSNDGVSIGTIFNESGQIDGGREYDGDDYVAVDDFTHSPSMLTAEAWVYRDSTSVINIFCKGARFNTCDWILYLRNDPGQGIDFGINNHASYVRMASTPENTWFYLTATFDAGFVVLYVNGTEVGNGTIASSINNNYAILGLGNDNDGGQPWNGLLDELRVSRVARNSSWIKTSFNSMNAPSTFSSVGTEEVGVVAEGPVVCDISPSNNSIHINLSLSSLSFDLIDYQGDLMDYTVETVPDIGSGSGVGVGNGHYFVPVSGLSFNMVYTWFVNVSDGVYSTEESFTFSTLENDAPILSDPSPGNDALGIPLNPVLSITVNDIDGDDMDVYFRTNASGTWETIGNYSGVFDGRFDCDNTSVMSDYLTKYWWSVNVTDPSGSEEWINQTFSFTTVVGSVSVPFAQGWQYRKKITIDHTLVDEDLTNFPVLISITDGDLVGHVQSDGDDIIFVDSDGVASQLHHEIEYYNSSDGSLIAWVNVTFLSSEVDTVLFMYYGNPFVVSSLENPSGVWDAGYVMVQHLNETGDALLDSSALGNDGVSFGTVFNSSGFVDGGREYTGNDYITVDGFTDSSDALTAEAWVYRNDSEYINIFCKGASFGASDWVLYLRTGFPGQGQGVDFGINNHSSYFRGGDTPVNTWFYLTATFDAGDVVLYVNGTEVGNGFISSSINNTFGALGLGNDNDGGQPWGGLLDELRVSCVPRNGSWVKTSFNTMDKPDSFLSLGSEEIGVISENPVVCDVSPVDSSENISIDLSALSFDLVDYQGDLMEYSMVTVPDISGGVQGGVGVGTGHYSVPVSGLSFNMVYTWFVNVSDGVHWTNETFVFSTLMNVAPVVSNPLPDHQSIGISLLPELSISVSDVDGDGMDVFFRTNASGSWETIGNYSGVFDGRFDCDNTSVMGDYLTRYWWSVNATDPTGSQYWTNVTYYFTTEIGPVSVPFAQGWLYRKMITIDHSLVDEDLVNFPVLISVTDSDLVGHAQSDGDDIIFVDSDGVASQLHHEIEYYNSSDGSLIAWVNVTFLSSEVDTVLYMYYGNPFVVSSLENPGGVWDAGYVMVQHLNETGDALLDSSALGNDGVSFGTVFNSSGFVDGGREYTGNDYITVDGFTHSSDALTAEAWVYRDNTSIINIFSKGTRYNTSDWILYLRNDYPGQGIDFGVNNHTSFIREAYTPENTWFYLTVTYDAGNVFFYVNGTEAGSGSIASSINNSFTSLGLGNDNDGGQPWDGILDELRVSRVVRNNGWIATSFHTMSSPDTFLSVDIEEVSVIVDEPIVCDEVPINDSTNVSVSLDQLCFDLIDYQGDLMEYSVVTVPDIGSDGDTGVGNGYYCIPVSNLKFNMAYMWFVNVSDGVHWTNKTFVFSTVGNDAPVLSNPSPTDGSEDVSLSPVLSVLVSDVDGDGMDVFFRTNASGSWETIGNYSGVGDGVYNCDNTSSMNEYLTKYWWSMNVTDPMGSEQWSNVTFCFMTEIGSVTLPFVQGWQYRKKITIDHTLVDEDLTNFPVLISITDGDLVGHVQSDGDDIIFVDSDGVASQLHHEIEYYNSSSGELIAWVNVTYLSSEVDTVLYMYYGNPFVASSLENPSGVWDAGYVMVQHLNETEDTLFDSTVYGNDGVSFGTVFNESGLIDGGREYDGHDYVAVDDFTHSPDALTAEAWVYRNDTEYINIYCKGTWYSACDWILYLRTGSETEGVDFGINNHNGSNRVRGGSTPVNTWFYLTATYDAGDVVLYVNGSEIGNDTVFDDSINNNHFDLDLGNENNGNQNWSGLLDELRVSKVARNSSWVKTSFHTMNSPNIFFSLDPEEVGVITQEPVVCDIYPLNNTVNVSTSLDMVSFDLIDYQGDAMNYSVVTVPDIGHGNGSNATNGRYSILVSGLKYNMAYTWFVNVTDPLGGGNWTNETFTFSTFENVAPVLSDPSPANSSEDVSLSPVLSISVSDVDGDGMDVFFRTNASGSWETIGNYSGVGDGRFDCDNTSLMNGYLTTYWWSVNVTDPSGSEDWVNQSFCFTTEVGLVTIPFAQGWQYRKKITIDHNMVDADLVNFPILINITDMDVAAHAQSDGDDIIFMDGDGIANRLHHEIEYYNSSDGSLIAWVNVTNLSSVFDTVLYMYYGNPLVKSMENVSGVWDSGYVMIQHLNETDDTLFDSTVYDNTGVSFGTVFNNSGWVDGGREYDGDDYVAVDDFTHSPSMLTAEAWVYRNDSEYINIYCKGTWYSACDWILYLRTGSETEGVDFGINNHSTGDRVRGGSTPVNTWFYLTATYDAGDVVLYVNGTEVGSGSISSSINNSYSVLGLGNSNGVSGSVFEPWGGLLDELRVSRVARNSSWVKASYNTMNSPSLFFDLGPEEAGEVSEEPFVCDVFPLNNSMNVSISLSELCFDLIDYQGDDMDYTVVTAPDIGSGDGSGVSNGWYFVQVSGLQFNMVYTWFVNVTDPLGSGNWTNESFTFSTPKGLRVADPSPSNGATDVPLNPTLQATISNAGGDPVDWWIKTNASGGWEILGNGTLLDGNGTVSVIPSEMKLFDTMYWWCVNVTNGEEWDNQTYQFTTHSNPQFNIKWHKNIGSVLEKASLVADLNGDGIKDVVQTSNGVVALNGVNGSILWQQYTDSEIGDTPSLTIADLNNDGIPEIVLGVYYPVGAIALHGNNGSVYWKTTDFLGSSHQSSPVVFDLDRDGYPTCFFATGHKWGGDAELVAVSYDGKIKHRTPINMTSQGGISLMDYDNDGHFEIYLGNRHTDLPDEPVSIDSFWAENLTLRWSVFYPNPGGYTLYTYSASSTLITLVDVTGDGIKDIVTEINDETDGNTVGLAVLSAENGSILRDIKDLMSGHRWTYSAAVYDIDLDGNPEWIWKSDQFVIWDLVDWEMDLEIDADGGRWQPTVADVTGDGYMDIVVPFDDSLKIYNTTFVEIATISLPGSGDVIYPSVMDLDNDGFNEIVVSRENAEVIVIETNGRARFGGARSGLKGYSEYRQGVSEYVTILGLKDEWPPRGSTDVVTNLPLFVTITNWQDELMDITFRTNASGTWGDIGSYYGVGDGTYNVSASNMNDLDTRYWWSVNVTDRMNTWTNMTYSFTTASSVPEAPVVIQPAPKDSASDVSVSLPELRFYLADCQGDEMDYTVETSPDIGDGGDIGVDNGTYTVSVSDLHYSTVYTWYVNVTTDGVHWTNKLFSFTTEPFDTLPPTIKLEFAGNLSDQGGPYYLPGNSWVEPAPDGYYTNASHQQEDWMYIKARVVDSGESGIDKVFVQWLNATTGVWTNNTYEMKNIGDDYYELNTSGNITVLSTHLYSFDILAIDYSGNEAIYRWLKIGAGGFVVDDRRYVQLAGIPTDIGFTPYYLYAAYYNSTVGYGSGHHWLIDDIMHHDQGPDGTLTDTGYLLSQLPTDTMEERHCTQYVGYWFDETVTAMPGTLNNIYQHIWWHSTNDEATFSYGKYDGGFYRDQNWGQFYNSTTENSRSSVLYDVRTYYLESALMNITSPYSYTDNDVYEFFINIFTPTEYPQAPSVINSRSIMSFVIFNVPDNATLQGQDTDNDGLNDYQELYVTFTSPFVGDTDNDGSSDYVEYLVGSDPNDYTDRAEIVAPIIVMESPVDGSFGHPLNPTLSVTVIHPANATMNVTFRTNASGPWVHIGTNFSVHNGTYSQIPTDMDSYGTIYYWSVNCSDGTLWTNETYWFRTLSDFPFVSNQIPENGAVNVLVSLSELSFRLSDDQGDVMNYTVETSPDIGDGGGTGVDNGTYTVSVSDLHYGTVYTWYVNVTDPLGSNSWTNVTFSFSTLKNAPYVSDPSPEDDAIDVSANPLLSIYALDFEGDSMNIIFRSNASGTWQDIGIYYNVNNETHTHQTANMTNLGATYWWSVNVTDSGSGNWTNNTYHFTTTVDLLQAKWVVSDLPRPHASGVLLADVTGDSIAEVILAGAGGVAVLDGVDGHEVWSRRDSEIDEHVSAQMADLNNDGILEVIVPLVRGVHVFHGNNGTTYWRLTGLSGSIIYSSPVVFDIDGYGYPTIYMPVQDIDYPYEGTLNMISHDGQLLDSTFLYRTCRGGLSLADADFDGEFEIYAGDRASGPGGGLRSFWASNLTSRWDQRGVGTISSHIPMIADVDEDGILDVIVCGQSSPYKLHIVSAIDGSIVKSKEFTPGHYQPSIHDIDCDGNLEIMVANPFGYGTYDVIVRDLNTTELDAQLREGNWACDFGPKAADVTGDGNMEMIVVTLRNIYIYNKTFDLIYEIRDLFEDQSLNNRLQFAMANDIDGDGLNEIVIARKGGEQGIGYVYAWDTPAPTPTPRPRSEVEYYSEYRLGAAEYVERPGPRHPMQRDIFPANESANVDLNPTLSAHVWDYQWDEFNITFRTNTSGDWEDIVSYYNIGRYPNQTTTGNAWGTYTANISDMNQLNTTYYWSIYAEDSKGNNIEKVYHFTTADVVPHWVDISTEPFNLIEPVEITNPVLTASNVTDMDAVRVYDPFIFHEDRSAEKISIFEGFESGSMNTSLWNEYHGSSSYGRNQVDYTVVKSGSFAWRMDVTLWSQRNLNELYTIYDFTGVSNINIDFWQYDSHDEETDAPDSWDDHCNADAVSFTNDGTTWYEIIDASTLNHDYNWWHFEYNISSHPNFDPNVNSSFAIKFQQYDNYPYPDDGRFWDDIYINFTIDGRDSHEWYMFFAAENGSSIADIALASSTDGFNWTYEEIVLNESFHTASPLVFRWGDTYYMVPESDTDSVKLYESKYREFPYSWTFVDDLLSGRDFTDSSILYYNSTWWMFVGDGDSSTCWLYYSYNFTDPSSWIEHSSSPISTNKNNARPAGRNIVFDGDRVIRLGMDSDPVFGQKVRAFEVDILTTNSYEEHEIPQSPILEESGNGWNAYGMHHVDPWWTGERWIAAVDGYGVYDWSIGIYATFVGEDIDPPEIKDVVDAPDPQEAGGYVNISCDVTDNVEVDTVKINVTGPDGFLSVNSTVDKWNCYYNNPYFIIGTYHYFIWANDTSGNANTSETYSFDIKTPTVVYVDDDYSDSTPGWQINHFDKIHDGIDAVEENGDVYVYNGTYAENVEIDKTIDLIGADKDNTTIDGGGSGNVVYSTVDWVNISGFTIKNGTNGIYLFSSSYNNISNNNISSASNYGIYLHSSSNNIIYNNYFSNINNAWDDGNNIWNISKTFGTNIIGGQYLGGNYWSDYTGVDLNGDGIGDIDLPYNCSGNIQNGGDWLPLTESDKKKITELLHEWNFVSLPFNQTVDKEEFIIRYNGTDYNWTQATTSDNPTGGWIILDDIYTWLRDQQGYDFTNILDSGYGYWMYAYYNCTLLVENVENIADDYITDLSVEWNIVGLPDDEPLSKEDFVINYNGTDYNWTQAITSDNPTGGWIVLDDIYTWLREQQGYDFTNILDSGYGYWMYAYYECTLFRPET